MSSRSGLGQVVSLGLLWLLLMFTANDAAHAKFIQFDLHDVVFDDGSTAEGYFGWDLSGFGASLSIQTSGGRLPPNLYDFHTSDLFVRMSSITISCDPFEATNEKQ